MKTYMANQDKIERNYIKRNDGKETGTGYRTCC